MTGVPMFSTEGTRNENISKDTFLTGLDAHCLVWPEELSPRTQMLML